MNPKTLNEIKELLYTIAEGISHLTEHPDDILQADITNGRAVVEQIILQHTGLNLEEQVHISANTDDEWIDTIKYVIHYIEHPLVTTNRYDSDFMQLMTYITNCSEETLVNNLKSKLHEIELRNPEFGSRLSDYYTKYPFWGAFNPANGIYESFELRAATLKRKVFYYIWLYQKFPDYLSKRTLFAILRNWAVLDTVEVQRVKSIFSDYYEPDIFPDNKDEVMVDVGAYIGDSIHSYINIYGNSYKKIYAYEISPDTFHVLQENTAKFHDIVLRQKGIGAQYDVMHIEVNSISSSANRLNQSSDSTTTVPIEVVPLDEDIDEPVTFIKMDIEGAEYSALLGCQRLIQTYHPNLAICTYHGYDDLWKLPTLINDIYDGYTFYFRHYGGNLIPTEFVLLCKQN